MNIAIFSPNQNPYSETFIQAHKNHLDGNIFYFFGPKHNMQLEGHKLLRPFSHYLFRFKRRLYGWSYDKFHTNYILASLKAHKIDKILIEYGSHAYNLKEIFKLCRLPIVVHFHGYDASIYAIIARCKNYKEVFDFSDLIISVSKVMTDRLIDLGCPKDKLIYNVYGPDIEFHNVNPNFESLQFLSLGRFVEKKAPQTLIEAFSVVLVEFPDATLLMGGEGELLNACKDLVSSKGMDSNVIFLGVITPIKFRELLKESLAFVQHSVIAPNGDMEGTPLSILEASLAGLPVISTNHAGIPDVIIHEKTGLLSEEHDVHGMAENMIKLLKDRDYAKKLGKSGKKNIQQNFSLDSHIECLNKLFYGKI